MRNVFKFRFPTLKFLYPLQGKLTKIMPYGGRHSNEKPAYDSLRVKIPEKNLKEEECIMLLKNNVTFVYPNLHDRMNLFEGEVVGFINPYYLHTVKNVHYFQDRDYYDKRYHLDIYNKLCNMTLYELEKTVFYIIFNMNYFLKPFFYILNVFINFFFF